GNAQGRDCVNYLRRGEDTPRVLPGNRTAFSPRSRGAERYLPRSAAASVARRRRKPSLLQAEDDSKLVTVGYGRIAADGPCIASGAHDVQCPLIETRIA